MNIENISPQEIEKRSFEIITEELGHTVMDELQATILKRVIHTTADFEYVNNLKFSDRSVVKALEAIKKGADIVTDTQMVKAGINKKELAKYGGEVHCFMSDEDIAEIAVNKGITRATASMEKAMTLKKPLIFAVGNAPTALIKLYEAIKEESFAPELIIGVPVGFVNVVQSKELIMNTEVPYIIAKGRKGGSNVAAAICNALLYMLRDSAKEIE